MVLVLSLGEISFFSIFAICLLSHERERSLSSQLRANCKAFWVGSEYTLGFRLVPETEGKKKVVLKTLQLGDLPYE